MARGYFKKYSGAIQAAASQAVIPVNAALPMNREILVFQNQGTHPMWVAFDSGVLPGASPLVAAPVAPTLAASASGGTLATGTYYVKVTYTNANGETVASAEANVAVTGPTGSITVTSPAAAQGATQYNVYASTTTNTETLQAAGTGINLGSNFILQSVGAGVSPPTTNTTLNGLRAEPAGTYGAWIQLDVVVPQGAVAVIGTAGDAYMCYTLGD